MSLVPLDTGPLDSDWNLHHQRLLVSNLQMMGLLSVHNCIYLYYIDIYVPMYLRVPFLWKTLTNTDDFSVTSLGV